MTQLWKTVVARLVRVWPVRLSLLAATRLLVPRQRVGVALVAFNQAQEVFMLRHVYHPYYEWGLPGGWLKRDEAPADGVLRELKEETGLTAVLGPVLAVMAGQRPPHIEIAYLGQLSSVNVQLSHEIREVNWFSVDELPNPLSRHTSQAIQAGLAYQRMRAGNNL